MTRHGKPCQDPDCTLPLYHPGQRCRKDGRPAPPTDGWRGFPIRYDDIFGDMGGMPWPQVAR